METIIRPKKGFGIDFRELWRYRELLYIFTWRDIKVRYKQTFFGVAWVLFQPVVTTAIFSIFFGKLAKIPSDNMPYPIFVYTGLTIWTFFSNALSTASSSLVSYEAMIKKIYFPRMLIPLSAILTAAVDFGVTFIFLIAMIIYYKYIPSLETLWMFPFIILILMAATTGLSLFTSALNVKYHDVRHILPFFIQIGLFVSPVIFPIAVIYDYRKWFLYINPLSGVIETARALIVNSPLNYPLIGVAGGVSLVLLVIGLVYFSKMEEYFADLA